MSLPLDEMHDSWSQADLPSWWGSAFEGKADVGWGGSRLFLPAALESPDSRTSEQYLLLASLAIRPR
jgi:hypothetical protein